jgi:hypothetical protein
MLSSTICLHTAIACRERAHRTLSNQPEVKMATRTWEPLNFCYCHHIDQKVALEADVVFPAEIMPDQEPRVLAHRCSKGLDCNLDERSSCMWAGTNPNIDPFVAL